MTQHIGLRLLVHDLRLYRTNVLNRLVYCFSLLGSFSIPGSLHPSLLLLATWQTLLASLRNCLQRTQCIGNHAFLFNILSVYFLPISVLFLIQILWFLEIANQWLCELCFSGASSLVELFVLSQNRLYRLEYNIVLEKKKPNQQELLKQVDFPFKSSSLR